MFNVIKYNTIFMYFTISITILIFSCSGKDSITESESRKGVSGVLEDFSLYSTNYGLPSWLLKADSAISLLTDTNDVYGIDLTFYNEQRNISTTVEADSGKQVVKTRDLFASGNLIIRSYFEKVTNNAIQEEWNIFADSMWQRSRLNKIDIYTFRLILYDSTSKQVAEVIADSGTYFLYSKDLRAQGNLKIITSSGGILLTDTLYYNNEEDIFSTDKEVTYIEGENILKGVGFESDPQLRNIVVHNAVRGTIVPEDI